jgi:amino acid adenylation domain-containing protein
MKPWLTMQTNSHSERLAALSAAKRSLLQQRLLGLGGCPSEMRQLTAGKRPSIIPASYAQRGLWFLDRLKGSGTEYNMSQALRIRGVLDVAALSRTVNTIVERHESLRTRFPEIDGEPVQVIDPSSTIEIPLEDLSGKSDEEQRLRIKDALNDEPMQPFDLTKGPLLRVKLIKIGVQDHILLRTIHHIVSDGWSEGVFNHELMRLYQAFYIGQANPLGSLPLQYADFALWQRKCAERGALEEGLAYWKEHLAAAPALQLPFDHIPQPDHKWSPASVAFHLDSGLAQKIKRISHEENVSEFMIFLAAYQFVLKRWTGQDDISVGTPMANRNQVELEGLIGCFVNTVVLRMQVVDTMTVRDLLKSVKELTLDAYLYQDVPFDRIVAHLQPDRVSQHTPLFRTMLVFQNTPEVAFRLLDTQIEALRLDVTHIRSMIDLYLFSSETGVFGRIAFDAALFEESTVRRLVQRFHTALQNIVTQPDAVLAELTFDEDLALPALQSNSSERTVIPLSYHQERLWFIDRFETDVVYEHNPTYHNLPLAVRLEGYLDVDALQTGIQQLVARHSILQTTIADHQGQPHSFIRAVSPVLLQVRDISGDAARFEPDLIQKIVLAEVRHPISLETGPLIRFTLFQLNKRQSLLLIIVHHIVADTLSLRIIGKELGIVYDAAYKGDVPDLPAMPLQYGDYAIWQRSLSDHDWERHWFYWKHQLSSERANIELPLRRPRHNIQVYEPAVHSFSLSAEQLANVRRLSADMGVTEEDIFLAVFYSLLLIYSDPKTFLIGLVAPRPNRSFPHGAVGPFSNLVAFRSKVLPPTFAELLARVASATKEACRNQEMPFELITKKLALEKDMSRTALFDVLFCYERDSSTEIPWGEIQATVVPTPFGLGKYDMTFCLMSSEIAGEGVFVYNQELYSAQTIEHMARHFCVLMNAVLSNPGKSIFEVALLSDSEKERQIETWNDTDADYPAMSTIHGLFEEQVAERAAAIALTFQHRHITYLELNQRANRLARHLRRQGVGPETLVAICLEKSEDLVVAILGILKSGGAYLPLNSGHPPRRLTAIVRAANVSHLVTVCASSGLGTQIPFVTFIDDDNGEFTTESGDNLNIEVSPRNLAYCIYTSGSTGTANGVLIEHRNVVRLLHNERLPFEFSRDDVWTMFHSYAFDFSVWEIFGALLHGGRLVIVSEEATHDPALFLDLLIAERVTILNQTPSAFYNLATHVLGGPYEEVTLRYIIFGGEILQPAYLESWLEAYPGIKLFNMFGITETTVHVTCRHITTKDISGASNIGGPIPTTRSYILNDRLELIPVGVRGEIYVGGDGLGRGYLCQPMLTAERFVANPFSKNRADRLYRTGDLGRYLPDGSIEYLGRKDDQVKVRGYRIDLGEVEAALSGYSGVGQARVVAREDQFGQTYLAGYVVAAFGERVDARGLRDHIRERLPEYMVPAAIVVLDQLPLTPNGKLDYKSLPAPESAAGAGMRMPRTPQEEILCALFAEVLGLERVGIDDSFFDLGGHSLMATRLVSRIRSLFDVDLPIRAVFEATTVGALAPRLRETTDLRPPLTASGAGKQKLSYAQQRLWFLDRLEGTSAEYNMPEALRLRGPLDGEALKRAINMIVERHEVLRTRFEEREGEPAPVIEPIQRIETPLEDLSGLSEREQRERIEATLQQDGVEPFDLRTGPLLRIKLLKLGEQDHVLLRTMHHIVSDAWSEAVFNRELMVLYEAFRAGKDNPLSALPVQYGDFAIWQRCWLEDGALDDGLTYWKNQLADIPKRLELPTDRTRPPLQSFVADVCHTFLGKESTSALKRLSRDSKSTLYMALLAGFGILLSRYSGQYDIVVGTVIANRQDVQLENLIGFFVNTLAIRVSINPRMSVRELLTQVRRTALDAYEHQDVPFERLIEELAPQRRLDATPVFQVEFTLQNAPRVSPSLEGIDINPIRSAHPQVRTDLEVDCWETDGQISFSWLYKRDLFDRWRMEQMAEHYMRVLDAITLDPDQPVEQLNLINAEERTRILRGWTNTAEAIPETSLPELIEEQVLHTPHMTAVVCGHESLNYAQLNERANRISHLLIAEGVRQECKIGVAVPRSLDTVVTLLAVLKAGAVYVPLDPNYPESRVSTIISDAQLDCLLTHSTVALRPREPLKRFVLDLPPIVKRLAEMPIRNPVDSDRAGSVSPQTAAYLIYTSGSTGDPKGILIECGSLLAKVWTLRKYYGVTSASRYALMSSVSFDPFFEQALCPLITGGASVVVPEELRVNLDQLSAYFRTHRISVAEITPSLAEEFVGYAREANVRLEVLVIGSDVLSSALANRILAADVTSRLINSYGPTEATIDAAAYEVKEPQFTPTVPIGRPLSTYSLYVLGTDLEPVPAGVTGELYIAGVGLARGYWRLPNLTSERFVANPFGSPGARMYRTGDLARWRLGGDLEFLGRVDYQVKIRGFRIELGEIECALKQQKCLEHAVVIARQVETGEKQLVAYVVPGRAQDVDAALVRTRLAENLPEYMVPSVVVVLEELPLTPNGKVDRRALPAPQFTSSLRYRAPLTPEQEILCQIFAEILEVGHVGLDDDFFALGGHSLMATRLVSRIRTVLGVDLPIRELFESPSVAELAVHLRDSGERRPALCATRRTGDQPLSYAQQRLWFLDRLQGSSTEYNMPEPLRLRGVLDRSALEKAINTIVDRHESLRTHFTEVDGRVVQTIEPALWIETSFEDLSAFTKQAQDERISAALKDEHRLPFDLARGPLLRLRLCKLSDQDHILLRTMHHIVSDGWSESVFNREFTTLYRAFQEGRDNPLRPLPVQYADFALWQREWLVGGALHEGLAYWTKQLSDIPDRLELPTDRPHSAVQSFTGDICHAILDDAETAALKRLSRDNQATVYMTLLAGFAVLLSRHSGQEDIVVGAPIANRQDAQLEGLIGFFINTLPIRLRVRPEMSLRELIQETRRTALEAYHYQDIPFERLVEEVASERSRSETPLVQVLFILQNAPWAAPVMPGLEVTPIRSGELQVHFDLELHVGEQEGKIGFSWLYRRDLFDRWRMEQMARHYVHVLQAMIANVDQPVWQIDMLDDNDRRRMLYDWNETHHDVSRSTLSSLFEAQAGRTPGSIAVVCDQETLTYAELNERANKLAHLLIQEGVGPESRVGVALPRSLEMLVSILAVLKAGAAYVPLDPDYPADRLAFMLQDSQPTCTLTTSVVASMLPACKRLLLIDDPNIGDVLIHSSPENPHNGLMPEHPAYVIYTSGSTGTPKGSVISHESINILLCWARETFGNVVEANMLASTSICFDSSVFELFYPIVWGGKTVVVDNVLSLANSPPVTTITHVNSVPSAIEALLRTASFQTSVRTVSLAGEALKGSQVRDIYKVSHVKSVINLYGLTECAVYSSHAWIPSSVESSVPIGRPVWNTRLYVLGKDLQLLPVGVAGELYIGGAGLARGYWRRPGLTAERFVANPYEATGERIYRSGDIARWCLDGSLEFLGRADEQIKIRGYRVEPGEIESVLKDLEGIANAAVIASECETGEKQLIAYVVPSSGRTIDKAELRARLTRNLPDYLVPSTIVTLREFPLTANGKLDRKALPGPGAAVRLDYRTPKNPEEELLCSLFAEVLSVPQVGIDDNFFMLGGHSLLAIRLTSLIRKAVGVELSLKTLFGSPTPSLLAKELHADDIASPFEPLLALRQQGCAPPLFCVHPGAGLSWCYSSLLQHIPVDHPIYGLQAQGISNLTLAKQTVEEMALNYAEEITKIQPEGPYYLLGYCFGGLVAHAMATILQGRGQALALLCLVSAYPTAQSDLAARETLGIARPRSLAHPADDESELDTDALFRRLTAKWSTLLPEPQIRRMCDLTQHHLSLTTSFVPGLYDGDVLLFTEAMDDDSTQASPELWSPHVTGKIHICSINARHEDLLSSHSAAQIGRYVSVAMSRSGHNFYPTTSEVLA